MSDLEKENNMTHHIKFTLLAALIVPGIAAAQINVGDTVGTSEAMIITALEAQGYVISETEIEDDEIEIEAMLDGQAIEIEISPETGIVLEVSLDDDEDGEDDDGAEDS
jgi:hypothetical protein